MMMDKKGTADALPEELEPAPKANNNYDNVDIMIPRGSEMSSGQVTGHKREIDGNNSGQASENPILSTQEYTI